ncbi:MAG: excinuclease ABC subunit UvrA [Fibrobacter sp.]|nr:excinuclease ABC subunit UvrA [Fibrobacter sp.]
MTKSIDIRDAHEHNLRHVSLNIPRDSIVVVTGVSGSGKSSLAFDTIFQEGQRRFVESLSAYARQFIGRMKHPEVESVRGISPTISIDQKTVNRNPRSTVGTVVEILDHYRLLFARLGVPHCPECGRVIQAQTVDQIVDNLYAGDGEIQGVPRQITVMAPIVQERKGEYRKELAELKESGFVRVRVDGEIYRIDEVPQLVRYEKHTIEAVVDRLTLERKNMSRLREALEGALKLTEGKLVSFLFGDGEYRLQGTLLACPKCGVSIPELEPRFFSFNDPKGQCPVCKGMGESCVFDEDLVVPDKNLSINMGALACQKKDTGDVIFSDFGWKDLRIIAHEMKFSLDTPWCKLKPAQQKAVLYGTPSGSMRGVISVMQELWDMWHIYHFRKYMQIGVCPECKGTRINRMANAVKFHGHNLTEMTEWSVEESVEFFNKLDLSEKELRIGREVLKEIRGRLSFLNAVGLGYLNISRKASTLSGGEAQRIRLASAVGAGLQGVLYVMDEPSIGLHPRDNDKLLGMLDHLRAQGNSLIVVEHDEDTMRHADYVVDVGPGAGVEGGGIIAAGTVSELEKNKDSLTGAYLSGRKAIEVPACRKKIDKDTPKIKICGAAENNLKNIDVEIPLDGALTVVTGVSGSGKSTLVNQILRRELARVFFNSEEPVGRFDHLEGIENIDKVIEIDQTPIGRTPRSNPATYTKIWDDIRDLFASMEESRIRGYKKGRFSFNVKGGRCDACEGAGVKEIDMHILPSVQVTCEVCNGKRFNDATREVYFKGKNVSEILDMSIGEAAEFFKDQPRIAKPLDLLCEVGLGYLTLGQPSTTLSGGEAQRIKIAAELRRPGTGKTLYLLDEPTTGLHFEDIRKLMDCLNRLRSLGNSIVVIEHNLDVIKCADWIVDLGPDAGVHGGEVIAVGTPEQIAKCKKSETGRYLAPVLARAKNGYKPVTRLMGSLAENKARYNATSAKMAAAMKGDGPSLDIEVRGARKHNLKNIDVTIPRHKLTVVTGVSGSGKSSLAFHTLFSEGQRRFVETLSTYARRFLGRPDRGSVDSISGLAPAIAIDQKSASKSPRSTVATLTEIYDYFRIFWSRVGTPHCLKCGKPVDSYAVGDLMRWVFDRKLDKMVTVLAPFEIKDVLKLSMILKEKGYRKVYMGGKLLDLPFPKVPTREKQALAVVDQVVVKEENRARLVEAFERAYRDGNGILFVDCEGEERLCASEKPGCPGCGWYMDSALNPKLFSFNTHWGACENCLGLGLVKDSRFESGKVCPKCRGERLKPEYLAVRIGGGRGEKKQGKKNLGMNIMDVHHMSIDSARDWFAGVSFEGEKNGAGKAKVAEPLLREIIARLDFLKSVGLGYIGLDRSGDTLSGGESQRIRLASQIGSGLEGVLYVLDEPTVGLHESDTAKLLDTLFRLRDLGNTLVVVEHDMKMMEAADHIIDMGPAAGEFGGEVVAEGSPKALSKPYALQQFPRSETVKYLTRSNPITNQIEAKPITDGTEFYEFENLTKNNLKDISVKFPKGGISVVCGVSGSGKSSMVMDEIYPALKSRFQARGKKKQSGEVLLVDQSPISGTPRSTPASFTGVFDDIRQLFAKLEQSKVKGFDYGRFSYNIARGRCAACEGRGAISVEMHFLSDVWEVCEACGGKRYNQETLSVYFKGKNIADVLDMRVSEACEFFKDQPKILPKLEALRDVGLPYVKLGQPVTTLSGGENQRLKLAAELARKNAPEMVYLLDEPTTGLHLKDIQTLWNQLRKLSARGNTVIIIEHHPDIIRLADWKVELGPVGGGNGGHLLEMGCNGSF